MLGDAKRKLYKDVGEKEPTTLSLIKNSHPYIFKPLGVLFNYETGDTKYIQSALFPDSNPRTDILNEYSLAEDDLFPITAEKLANIYTIGGKKVKIIGYSGNCKGEQPTIGCTLTVKLAPAEGGGRRITRSRRRSRPRPRRNRRRSRKN